MPTIRHESVDRIEVHCKLSELETACKVLDINKWSNIIGEISGDEIKICAVRVIRSDKEETF
jgi:hypothetical protein